MNENIFWKLLLELKELCEANQITYFLGGEILRYSQAVSEEKRALAPPMGADFGGIELYMDGANAKKLLALEKELPCDRMLEHPLRNPKFRNLDIYYIDKTSTYIDFECLDRRECLGAFIPIRIIVPNYNGPRQSFNLKLERMWRTSFSYHHSFSTVSPKEEKLYEPFRKLGGDGDFVTVNTFRYLLNTKLTSETSVRVYTRRSRKLVWSRFFKGKRLVTINGVSFVTVKETEAFLKCVFGSEWAEVNFRAPSRYLDENRSYPSFEKKLYHNDAFWKRRGVMRHIRQSSRVIYHVAEDNWTMATDIYAGIKEQDDLLTKKEVLLRMQELEDYTGILGVMVRYKKVLLMQDQYGIEIDPLLKEIYQKAMTVLEIE